MSVQRRPKQGKDSQGNVKWVVRYRDRAGKEHSKTFSSADYKKPAEAAKSFDATMRDQLRRGTWIDPDDGKKTVREVTEVWVETAVKAGTKDTRRHLLANLGDLADITLGALRPSHVTTWVSVLRTGRPWAKGRPLSDATIRVRLGQLQSVMQIAVDDDMLAKNPVRVARRGLGSQLRSVDEREVPSVEQINRLIETARTGGRVPGVEGHGSTLAPAEWLAQVLIISSETGLRIGEVAGLIGDDVDLDAGLLHVQRQCPYRVDELTGLKSEASDRFVPISAALVRDLRRWMRGPEDRVVAGPKGHGVSSPTITTAVAKCRKIAGVPDTISAHGTRHFFATSLLAAGEPLQTVSSLLGHDSISTTGAVYSHFLPDHLEASRAAVKSLAGSLRDGRGELRVVG
jgi:integrase